MDSRARALRRKQLDRQLLTEGQAPAYPTPPSGGWIHAVREALGMNLAALGKRLGVSRQSAFQLEKAEVDGSITLKRMRSAAEALECDLVVLLVPRQPFENAVRQRALRIAAQEVGRTSHTMGMEGQGVASELIRQMIEESAEQLVAAGDPRIWE